MTALAPPRHRLVELALADATRWCAGRVIDDRPALAHAARVAVAVGGHQPGVAPEVIAAALLHDGPEFAPPGVDLDLFLTTTYGPLVRRLVRGMQAEHDALDAEAPVIPNRADADLALLSTADKVVALTSLLRRARLSGDVRAFFAVRRPLLALLDHFRACQLAAVGVVPDTLSTALGRILDDLDHATADLRPPVTGMDTRRLDPVIADLCNQAGIGQPSARHPIRVWELSGVERLTFADTPSVIVKYAGPPFTGEADVLRAARERGVPVPDLLASTILDSTLIMFLEDLGGSSHPPTDLDGATAAACLHTAHIRPDRLPVWDAPRLAALPSSAIAILTALRERGRLTAAADLLPLLEQLARAATALVDGAETAPFGLVHGELHPTSLHIGVGGWRLVDFAKAFVGPGLLDLATWQGTRYPADIPRLEAQLHAYVAAGGSARVHQPRGGHPAAVWALGWHRLWSAGWFLRQATASPDDDRHDQEVEAIIRRQITTAVALLRR